MAEMTNPRKNHRQTQAVSCFDDFLVPDRSSWLNNGSRTGSGNFFHSVGEGEKGIGGSYRPMQRKYGLHRSDFAGIHTRHLPCPDAQRMTIARIQNSVGFHMLANLPV